MNQLICLAEKAVYVAMLFLGVLYVLQTALKVYYKEPLAFFDYCALVLLVLLVVAGVLHIIHYFVR